MRSTQLCQGPLADVDTNPWFRVPLTAGKVLRLLRGDPRQASSKSTELRRGRFIYTAQKNETATPRIAKKRTEHCRADLLSFKKINQFIANSSGPGPVTSITRSIAP